VVFFQKEFDRISNVFERNAFKESDRGATVLYTRCAHCETEAKATFSYYQIEYLRMKI